MKDKTPAPRSPPSKRAAKWAKLICIASPAKRIHNTLRIAEEAFNAVASSSKESSTRKTVLSELEWATNDRATGRRILSLGDIDEKTKNLVHTAINAMENADASEQRSQFDSKSRRRKTIGFSWTHLLALGRMQHTNRSVLNKARQKLLKSSLKFRWPMNRFSREIRKWNEESSDLPRSRPSSRPTHLVKRFAEQTSLLDETLSLLLDENAAEAAVKIHERDKENALSHCRDAHEKLKKLKGRLDVASMKLKQLEGLLEKRG